MTREQKEDLIASLVSTPEGRRKLAQSMTQPLKSLKRASCPVCGERVSDLVAHCDAVGDPGHLAASVIGV